MELDELYRQRVEEAGTAAFDAGRKFDRKENARAIKNVHREGRRETTYPYSVLREKLFQSDTVVDAYIRELPGLDTPLKVCSLAVNRASKSLKPAGCCAKDDLLILARCPSARPP
jgi:hypothetical protein